jgi:hypothetical protein
MDKKDLGLFEIVTSYWDAAGLLRTSRSISSELDPYKTIAPFHLP